MKKNELIKLIDSINENDDDIIDDLQTIIHEVEQDFNLEIHLSLSDFLFVQEQTKFNFCLYLDLTFDRMDEIESKLCELIEL